MAEATVARFLRLLRRQLGTPYVFGTEGPNQFDCSGLIWWALSRAGVNIPRSSANGYYQTVPGVAKRNLRPGDLIYYNYGRLGSGQADHVGVYIGSGKTIDTRSPENPVAVRAVDWGNVIGYGRVASLGPSSQKQVAGALANLKPGGGGPVPAWAAGGDDLTRGELRGILRGLGLSPDQFMPLITQAIQGQWSQYEVEAAIYDSNIFKRTFPGIFNKDGSLKMSPAEYVRVAYGPGGYADIAREFGLKVDRRLIGTLIGNNKSPDEWAFEANVIREARAREPFRRAINRTLKAMGQEGVNEREWAEYVAGKPNARIENIYEAAYLQAEPDLAINAKQAIGAARSIGAHGEIVDVKALVQKIRETKEFIEPELRSAGITDADLAVLESGADPKAIRGTLEQLLRNRSALVGQRLVGAGAGTPLYPAAREGL